MTDRIRIATRESALALWQANHVKSELELAYPGLHVEIVGMTTEGDRNKKSPLSQIGGKGVFVKELEVALLEERADIAVHSMKDVPSELPASLKISAMCKRDDPRDALISNSAESIEHLPKGSRVGSSSLRRRLQLKLARPDLKYVELRGNVDTRLRKLDEGEYDAVILATAGLKRLGLVERISQKISTDLCVPAAGQGAVGIESRAGDEKVNGLLAAINDYQTFDCVSCEREVTIGLGANCNLPIAAYAELTQNQIKLNAYVSDVEGLKFVRQSSVSDRADALNMARTLTQEMLSQGADRLIASHGE
ncbi:MAG: hydroxymethylbilane synthase [Pseudomonadales bacterium]|jgi:hydroxymethylbilane synthase|nr:hydroxymethylbilane synthase [Pseudomonadales bacterium]